VTAKKAASRPEMAGGIGSLLPRAAIVPGLAVSLAGLGYAALAAFVSLHMLAHGVINGIAAFDAFGFTYIWWRSGRRSSRRRALSSSLWLRTWLR